MIEILQYKLFDRGKPFSDDHLGRFGKPAFFALQIDSVQRPALMLTLLSCFLPESNFNFETYPLMFDFSDDERARITSETWNLEQYAPSQLLLTFQLHCFVYQDICNLKLQHITIQQSTYSLMCLIDFCLHADMADMFDSFRRIWGPIRCKNDDAFPNRRIEAKKIHDHAEICASILDFAILNLLLSDDFHAAIYFRSVIDTIVVLPIWLSSAHALVFIVSKSIYLLHQQDIFD